MNNMVKHRFVFVVALLAVLRALASPVFADEKAQPATVKPVPRADDWWQKMNDKFNARARQGDVELLFLGDSITQGWNDNAVWRKFYGRRKAANFGIGGDRTQHVLWRIENGNLDVIRPKLAVLMIGTNNAADDSAEDIAAGIKAIVAELRRKLPRTKVLLLAIFPRDEKPSSTREKLAKASELASQVADDRMVRYLDIGPKFLQPDGTLSKDIMPDFLHLSPQGYLIWAEAIEPSISEMLGERAAS
jgi:lysophospholipase L1-like esterase